MATNNPVSGNSLFERAGSSYYHIAAGTTAGLVVGAGVLRRLIVNKPLASSVITLYDNTVSGGTVIAIVAHPAVLLAQQYFLEYECSFAVGLTLVTTSADDITLIYN